MEIPVVRPDLIAGYALESNEGVVGIVRIGTGDERLNIVLRPDQLRQMSALILNLSDATDGMERRAAVT